MSGGDSPCVTARFSAMSARAASYALCACFLLVSAQARPGLRPHMVSAHARPGLCPHTRTRRKPNETSHGSRRKPEEPSYGSACVMELDNRSYDRPIKFRSINYVWFSLKWLDISYVWHTLNWNVMSQRLPWQTAGSGDDHA